MEGLTIMQVRIIECTETDELYRHYARENQPQPAYIELDLRDGSMLATYNVEVDNSVPPAVRYRLKRRYDIPVLTSKAANRVMREIAPLAERVLADHEEGWNGSNHVAFLGDDAIAAEEELEKRLALGEHWDESDLLTVWDVDSAVNGEEADEYGITADTTDERLDEIAAEITRDMGVDVVNGLDGYLRQVRDELAEEDPITPAELRTAREHLGLTGDHMAKLLRVNPRTLRSWEHGRDPIPGRIRPEIAELKAATAKAVAELAASRASEEETILTYRDDEGYQAAHRGGRWSASWHRRVCARVAEQTGARIAYAGDDEG